MPKVTFRNILDEQSEFKEINMEYLVPTVYEYARTCGNDELYSAIMKEKIVIYIDNEYIKIDDWATYKLNESSEIIITPELVGDHAGAFLQMAVGVVILVVSTVYNFPPGQMLGAALILGGISSLLFQPDLPNTNFISSGKSQTYSWSGIRTMAQEDTPIPVVYGTHKVGGNLISMFTERYGEDDYLYMLLALSEGEIDGICQQNNYASVCSTSDPTSGMHRTPAIELDDQPLTSYNNVSWWYRRGVNATDIHKTEYDPSAQNLIPNFDGSKTQFDDGRDITSSGVVYTTTKEVDKVVLQIRAPALYDGSNAQVGIAEKLVVYRVQFRKEGTSTWYDYYPFYWYPYMSSGVRVDGSAISSPTSALGVSFTRPDYVYYYAKPQVWTFQILNLTVGGVYQGGGYFGDHQRQNFTYTIRGTNTYTNESVIGYTTIVSEWAVWQEYVWLGSYDSNFQPLYELVNRAGPISYSYSSTTIGEYTVTPTMLAQVGDTYTMSVASGYATTLDINMYGKTKTGLWSSIVLDFNNITNAVGKDVYEIRLYRPYGDKSTSLQVEDNILLYSVVEIIQGNFIYPNVALFGIKIKATDQLSGSPPNITTVIRGLKIKVPDIEDTSPSGANVLFGDCYWDSAQNRWENSAGNEVFWNDTSSWRTEYSNNSMLCVKDFVLSRRYGLGEYINANDLYTSGVNNIMKLCHVSYEPTEGDHIAWWDGNNADVFDDHIHASLHTESVSIDNAARTITFSTGYSFLCAVDLDSPLYKEQTYQVSITFGGLTKNINVSAELCDSLGIWSAIGSTITNVGNGTQTISFAANKSGYSKLRFFIINSASTDIFTGVISDISLNRTSTKKLHYHTWDGVFDNAQSALSVLLETCDSFRVWPVWFEGKFNFIMNKDETPIQTLSRGNTIELTQNFSSLMDIPYRFIGQYTDEDRKWEMKSLIARATDTTLTKVNERNVGLKGITNRKKAERELKFKLNQVTNCTHFINLKAGLDSVHFTGGDVFYLQDDLPQWGQGGRVLDYSATSLESNIIGWWKLNEGSGTNIADSSGQGNSGTLYNTDAGDWITGVNGYGLYFNDGEASEYGQVNDAAILDTIQTFSCWVHPVVGKSHATTYHILVSKHTGTGYGLYIDYASSPNKFWFWVEDSTGATSGSSYTILDYNKWYHLTGVFTTNKKALLYVDGLPQTEGNAIADASGSGTNMTGAPLRISGGLANRYSTAKIDEILVFNRLLTDDEIVRLAKYPPKGLYISTEDIITISDRSATNIIRYQTSDNTYVTATVNTATVPTTTDPHYLKLLGYPTDKQPKDDAVFAFGKSGSFSKKFRALSTVRNKTDEIEINAIEHLSTLYDSEPTITIAEDRISALPNPLLRPNPPQNVSVIPNLYFEGLGFTLAADPPTNVSGVKEIIVKMKKSIETDNAYETIAIIPTDRRSITYSNDKLELDTEYTFRFTCRTQFKTSNPVDVTSELSSANFVLTSPTGLRLKGKDPNSHIFDGKDVTLEWNPANFPTLLGGYLVEVYHTFFASSNKLRESFVSNESFVYSFENMIEDTGGLIYGTSTTKLVFVLYSVNKQGSRSVPCTPFAVYNEVPDTITSLVTNSVVGGVRFSWSKSTELDHKSYEYGTKVSNGSWNTATKVEDSTYTRHLSTSEILNYGRKSTIYIRVRDIDWYKQTSATYALTSASANILSDNLFQLAVSKSSGITGNVASLYDNRLSSGGVTVT